LPGDARAAQRAGGASSSRALAKRTTAPARSSSPRKQVLQLKRQVARAVRQGNIEGARALLNEPSLKNEKNFTARERRRIKAAKNKVKRAQVGPRHRLALRGAGKAARKVPSVAASAMRVSKRIGLKTLKAVGIGGLVALGIGSTLAITLSGPALAYGIWHAAAAEPVSQAMGTVLIGGPASVASVIGGVLWPGGLMNFWDALTGR
jgi:hypothetical protein